MAIGNGGPMIQFTKFIQWKVNQNKDLIRKTSWCNQIINCGKKANELGLEEICMMELGVGLWAESWEGR